ncbi:fibrous sheath CABYR-binding protein-like, partial [Dermacentor silvarum]|uniref:fibrous sheath CABYR-binding protein-like n=1 Tax=Dermacentor silvarum TaxID=543639 RepID=UPI0021016F02
MDQSKIQPADMRAATELSPSQLRETESLDEIERGARAVFSTDAAGATHFAFSVRKRSLTDTCSQTQLPSSSLKRCLSWTSAQNAAKTPVGEEVKTLFVDAGVLFGGPQYDADQVSLDRASTSSQATADITDPKKSFPVTAQNALEVELGFEPTTDIDVATDQSGRSQSSSTPVGQCLPFREGGVPPAILSEHHHSPEVQPSDSTREGRPSELEELKASEDGGGHSAKGRKATITEVLSSDIEAKSSPAEKDVTLLRTEPAEHKPSLSAKDHSTEGVEGWQSTPVVTEEGALPEDASAVSPSRGEQEGYEVTGKELDTREEKHITDVLPNATETMSSSLEKDMAMPMTKLAEQKPPLSARNQSSEGVEGWQSPPGVTEEGAPPQAEARTTEEIQAPTEEAAPAVETAAQVEAKPAVEATAAEEKGEPEDKTDIQPPTEELPLHPMVTGGLLDGDSTITEHAKPEETTATVEEPVGRPSSLVDISGETKVLVDVVEPLAEAKKTEEIQAHTIEAAPATETAAQVETKPAVEAAAAEESREPEAKADIQPPEITEELPLHPMVTGGLLDGDITITEHAKPEETKATVEEPVGGPSSLADISGETKVLVDVVEPLAEAKKTEEIQAHTEEAAPEAETAAQVETKPAVEAAAAEERGWSEAKADIQPNEISDELPPHPMATGGLLEGDSTITEHAKPEQTKATVEEPVDGPSSLADISGENKVLVDVVEPLAEAKKTEEIQAPTEEAAPAAETAAQVETKPAVEAAAAEERREPEAKADIQPPTEELPLHPMATGGLLDGDITITEHAKPEETKATVEEPVGGPSSLADISGETKVLVDVVEPLAEAKETEEIQAHTEEAAPAAETAAQVETKPAVEAAGA